MSASASPYLRPIVRGKAKSPVEFGAKYDVSIDEKGHARLEKLSFDAYNENTIFVDAMNRYKERTGHYPKRVLVDQIYRTRDNRISAKTITLQCLVRSLDVLQRIRKVPKRNTRITLTE